MKKDEEISMITIIKEMYANLKEAKRIYHVNSIIEKIQLYFDLKNNYYSLFDPSTEGYTYMNSYKFQNNKRKNRTLNIMINLYVPIEYQYAKMDEHGVGVCWNDKTKWYHKFLDKIIVKECEKRWKCFSDQTFESIKNNEIKYKLSTLVNV